MSLVVLSGFKRNYWIRTLWFNEIPWKQSHKNKNFFQKLHFGASSLVVHPVHEWEHFIDISYAAQNISIIADDPERKTVISLDIRLYLEPAKKLQMAQNDLNHLILHPSELHIVMAMLRTIGACIDSGIDMCWIESELHPWPLHC